MNKRKFPVTAIILCIAFAALARVTGVVYSSLATNIIYSDSVICQLLPALRQVLSALSFTCAAGGAMSLILAGASAKAVIIVYIAVAFVENLVPLLMDVFSGIFTDDPARLLMGIAYRLVLAAYSVLMLAVGLSVGKAIIKRGGAPIAAIVFAGVLPVGVDLIAVMWKSITSLIEWEFMPYADEIYTMLYEAGAVILAGVLSAGIAILLSARKK